MKFRSWKVGCWIALLSGVGLLSAQSADTPAKPGEPAPGLATVTNLSRPFPKKDSLKQLEEEFARSLQPFSPKGSLDSVLGPNYVPNVIPVIPNRRPKSDGERNWDFSTPDKSAGAQDPFKSPGGAQKGNSMEDFYFNMQRERANTALSPKSNTTRPGRSSLDNFDEERLKLPSGLRESIKGLREKLLGSDNGFNQDSTRGSLSDLFAPDAGGMSREQMERYKDYRSRYSELLSTPASESMGAQNSIKSLLGGSSSSGYKAPDLLSPSTRSDTFASTPAAMNSILHPATLPDMNDRVLNQWNPLYAPPAIETPKSAPLLVPTMETPRRRF